MGQRAYRRDSRGRFAGGGSGTKVTYGRAGGWANPAHQAKSQAARASARSGGTQAKPSAGQRVQARVSAMRAKRQARIQARKDAWNALSPQQKRKVRRKKLAIALATDIGIRTLPAVIIGGAYAVAGAQYAVKSGLYDAAMRQQAKNTGAAFAATRGITAAMSVPRTARRVKGAYRITSLR